MITAHEITKSKDLMAKGITAISSHTPVLEAAKILIEKRITNLHVVTQDKEMIGILSEKDILKLYYEPEFGKALSVEEFMTEKVHSFDDNVPNSEISDCLIDSSFRRMLNSSEEKPSDIITRRDLIRYIIQLAEKN